ncbi:S24 family peptidase [Sphingomonas sp. 37zxx]|uniref:S24 family peptidase n=1 Tax=Sphingomonas sp. 37zxx TaxID=1550073 RepID=UPI00053BF91F|nr:S24 family peptidase [Sphingomonas sp. 37zxx]
MDSQEQRAALARIAGERGVSLARLSRVLGRNAAYVQQYVARGSPRLLPERERGLIADFLGVAEAALGGPAELMTVPRFDVAASAGPGGVVEIDLPERPARIDPLLLDRLGVRAQAASMIRVAGDSMAPTLIDGDEILVDADARLSARGGVYVIRRDGVVMVKRLRRAGNGLDIISDNPACPSWRNVDPATIAVIGRVAWVSRCLV